MENTYKIFHYTSRDDHCTHKKSIWLYKSHSENCARFISLHCKCSHVILINVLYKILFGLERLKSSVWTSERNWRHVCFALLYTDPERDLFRWDQLRPRELAHHHADLCTNLRHARRDEFKILEMCVGVLQFFCWLLVTAVYIQYTGCS
jgi:hypothetical protein